ncbi:hypothetical protein [Sphingobium yanoikuyae]|jgi:hypothetical protein|uniref:hypothetical protein n=1 Tax=Sphingobium yanoikuyae TaxID=13690 RepID=UPI000F7EE8F0|nr:hypothetical protein [Sphingobium yanoikuyae]
MSRIVKIALGVVAVGVAIVGLGILFLRIDYEFHKTSCSKLSDAEALSTLRKAFDSSLERSRPEDYKKFQFVPVIHRDSSYPEDDPNHSVKVDIVDKASGQKVRQMHLFGDCDIETWGVGDVAITK